MKVLRDLECRTKNDRRRVLEIDYLDDNVFVAFVSSKGDLNRKVSFAKSSHILGYNDNELKGFDYTELVPITLRAMHDNVDLFGQLLKKTTESWASGETLPIFLSHKLEKLVPVWLKVRLFLDAHSDISIAILAKIRKNVQPFAFFNGSTITECTFSFENVLLNELNVP